MEQGIRTLERYIGTLKTSSESAEGTVGVDRGERKGECSKETGWVASCKAEYFAPLHPRGAVLGP